MDIYFPRCIGDSDLRRIILSECVNGADVKICETELNPSEIRELPRWSARKLSWYGLRVGTDRDVPSNLTSDRCEDSDPNPCCDKVLKKAVEASVDDLLIVRFIAKEKMPKSSLYACVSFKYPR